MSGRRKPPEEAVVEVEDPKPLDQVHTEEEIEQGKQNKALDHSKQNKALDHSTGTPDYVTREEFDSAIKHYANEVSRLKEVVADLEQIVTQPAGAVTFQEVVPKREDEDPAPDAQWYTPGYLQG